MKILITLFAGLFALSAQAQTTFEHFTAKDEWPAFEMPGGELMPNIIFPGEFFCTGGGTPIILDGGPPTFQCSGGKGIHIRGTEMISYLGNSKPYDPRVEGLVWFDIAANWDSDCTGPVIGNWRIEPYAFMEDPATYWEGTYVGKRELLQEPNMPATWITTLRLEGYGMGALTGQQIKATEVVTTFNNVPVPWELLGLDPAGPEGQAEITIITAY